ncbi:MAG: DUF1015 domain-containing protein [Planctomyces sp.]|nr:DUF1015 domain-containing protein [Planctomyces sp.]
MVRISPVRRALAPVNSDAAQRVSAQNYDEFQSDREVWDILQAQPDSLLRVTMPHCDAPTAQAIGRDGSPESLQHGAEVMRQLAASPLMRTIPDLLWVYEIASPKRPSAPQIGLGGCAHTNQIRTESNPGGVVIRNEGIHPDKAAGRARLLEAIGADTGFVNLAVADRQGELLHALQEIARERTSDFEAGDEAGNRHRVWLVSSADIQKRLIALVGREAAAYVADGNHRSAAAASLGHEHFLAVFFPVSRMGLEPYNRLLKVDPLPSSELLGKLETAFQIQPLGPLPGFRPRRIHELGLYVAGEWYELRVRPEAFDAASAAASIDADIVQRQIIDRVFGISDARDKRVNYVGGNKDAAWLKAEVDAGRAALALSLAPVTMEQFVAVCEQNQFMPPKSTWFDPKIRTGLVISLLEQN